MKLLLQDPDMHWPDGTFIDDVDSDIELISELDNLADAKTECSNSESSATDFCAFDSD